MKWFKKNNIIIIKNEEEKQIIEWLNHIKEKYDCYGSYEFRYTENNPTYNIYTEISSHHQSTSIQTIIKLLPSIEAIVKAAYDFKKC